jgi:hypothetical protein
VAAPGMAEASQLEDIARQPRLSLAGITSTTFDLGRHYSFNFGSARERPVPARQEARFPSRSLALALPGAYNSPDDAVRHGAAGCKHVHKREELCRIQ